MFQAPIPGQSRTHGRRAVSRARLNIPGRLILRCSTQDCLIEDLSRTGARLALRSPPALGETGVLQINRIEGFGATVWVRGARCGFQFDDPLALEEVVGLRNFADHFSEIERARLLAAARAFVQGPRGAG